MKTYTSFISLLILFTTFGCQKKVESETGYQASLVEVNEVLRITSENVERMRSLQILPVSQLLMMGLFFMMVLLTLIVVSWYFRPVNRKIASVNNKYEQHES